VCTRRCTRVHAYILYVSIQERKVSCTTTSSLRYLCVHVDLCVCMRICYMCLYKKYRSPAQLPAVSRYVCVHVDMCVCMCVCVHTRKKGLPHNDIQSPDTATCKIMETTLRRGSVAVVNYYQKPLKPVEMFQLLKSQYLWFENSTRTYTHICAYTYTCTHIDTHTIHTYAHAHVSTHGYTHNAHLYIHITDTHTQLTVTESYGMKGAGFSLVEVLGWDTHCAQLQVRPGESIGDAVRACPQGGTVWVHDGEYMEEIVLDKPITVLAVPPGRPTICATTHKTPTVLVTSYGVHVHGLQILHPCSQPFTDKFPPGFVHDNLAPGDEAADTSQVPSSISNNSTLQQRPETPGKRGKGVSLAERLRRGKTVTRVDLHRDKTPAKNGQDTAGSVHGDGGLDYARLFERLREMRVDLAELERQVEGVQDRHKEMEDAFDFAEGEWRAVCTLACVYVYVCMYARKA
jgi:hypothetical protein